MQVKTKDDKAVTLGEMNGGSGEVGHIAEMVTDSSKLDTFQDGWGAVGAALATACGDEKPEFAVVRVEEGWSGSARLWDAKEVNSIVTQTNSLQPVGHLGHIEDAHAATAMPEPQTTWFAAKSVIEPSQQKDRLGEMVTTAYFAGYNLPGAKVRQYIKGKAVRGISWWGTGDQVPVPGKGVQVKNFTLKALDWARKGSEGMPTSSVVAVTGEMKGANMKDLATVTPAEFKAENPNGYALLVAEAQAEQQEKIGEMEVAVTEAEGTKTLVQKACEALGIEKPEDLITKITDLTTRLGDKARVTVDTALDKLLMEKLPGEDNAEKRALVKRLVPIGEMEAKVADAKDATEAEKFISEMLDNSFDTDAVIKTTIGEMQPPVVRRREELQRGAETLKDNDYVKPERVTFAS